MMSQTVGTVTRVTRQWWCKINTTSVRKGTMDGATFPHVVRVTYTVKNKTYVRRKWLHATIAAPTVGEHVTVQYDVANPKKATFSFHQ